MRWKPHSTVATIIEKDGKLLFVEELDAGQLVYNQPAGHLEENESLIAAAVRETQEESAYLCEITGYLGLYTYTAASNGVTYHRHCFVGKALSYDAQATLDEGIRGIRWLTPQELIASNKARSPLVIRCAEDYFKRPHYPIELIYEHQND
ncbi:MAG: NUDIX hydrolase [Bermanella sp.]|jgi:ADP-ribose pyrophosphatase